MKWIQLMPRWIDFTVQTLQWTFLSGNTDLLVFPVGLSNAHILHKLGKKSFDDFCIDISLTKSKNLQDKNKKAVVS